MKNKNKKEVAVLIFLFIYSFFFRDWVSCEVGVRATGLSCKISFFIYSNCIYPCPRIHGA